MRAVIVWLSATLVLGTAGISAAGPIHAAAEKGNLALVRLLVQMDPSQLEATNDEGATPLQVAAVAGRRPIVQFLLDEGAPVDSTGSVDLTPLHLVAFVGKVDVAQLLMRRGANVNARGAFEVTPLMVAAAGGQAAIVELLLSKGADPAARSQNGTTARSVAIQRGYPQIAFLLSVKGGPEKRPSEEAPAANADAARQLAEEAPIPALEHTSLEDIDGLIAANDRRFQRIEAIRGRLAAINPLAGDLYWERVKAQLDREGRALDALGKYEDARRESFAKSFRYFRDD